MQKFLCDNLLFCMLERRSQEITKAAWYGCQNLWKVQSCYSDNPVHGGMAGEIICPPMTLEACVPSASACGAPKSWGDLCLVHFSTRMKPQRHKRAGATLRSSYPKDIWGPSASAGFVAFLGFKACFCWGRNENGYVKAVLLGRII